MVNIPPITFGTSSCVYYNNSTTKIKTKKPLTIIIHLRTLKAEKILQKKYFLIFSKKIFRFFFADVKYTYEISFFLSLLLFFWQFSSPRSSPLFLCPILRKAESFSSFNVVCGVVINFFGCKLLLNFFEMIQKQNKKDVDRSLRLL